MKTKKKIAALFLICMLSSLVSGIYYTNWIKGVVAGIVYAIGVFICVTMILLILGLFVRNKRLTNILYGCFGGIAIVLLVVMHSWTYSPSPRCTFERVFYTSFPSSVGACRSIWEYPGKDGIFRLRFAMDTVDLSGILNRFTKIARNSTGHELHDFTEDSALASIEPSYLMLCDSVSWWDTDKLMQLPMYGWSDDQYLRTLWIDHPNGQEMCTVYVSGFAF